MIPIAALLCILQAANPAILENEYVKVTRNGAPCASPAENCGDRIVVALGPMELDMKGRARKRKMKRGDVAVFDSRDSYAAPATGDYLEVAIKPSLPPVKPPAEMIAPAKNRVLYDGKRFFVFEEKLAPGQTRARHSHSQRVVIVLNGTQLQQWVDDHPPLFRKQIPDDVRFNDPVVHIVRTIGERPLRNIVIEFKPGRP